MVIEKSGQWWRSSEPADLEAYVRAYSEENYPVGPVRAVACSACGHGEFSLVLDDDEGFARRTCAGCDESIVMLDSATAEADAQPDDATCPCGGTTFNAAVGFALIGDGDVRWVYVGLRCVKDGTMGVYTDWKIDYSPSRELLERV